MPTFLSSHFFVILHCPGTGHTCRGMEPTHRAETRSSLNAHLQILPQPLQFLRVTSKQYWLVLGRSVAYTGLKKYAHLLPCDHRFCAGRIRRLQPIASELQTPSSRVTATALSNRPLPFTGQCCRVRAACLMQIGFIWSPGGDEPWHTRHISIWEDPDKGETNTVDRGVLYIHSSPLTRCHLHMSQENI